MVKAARLASAGAFASTDGLNAYLGRCTLDLFSTIMLGELSYVSKTTTPTNHESNIFVPSAANGLSAFNAVFALCNNCGETTGAYHKKMSVCFYQL